MMGMVFQIFEAFPAISGTRDSKSPYHIDKWWVGK